MPNPEREVTPETQAIETPPVVMQPEATTPPVETPAVPNSTEQRVEAENQSVKTDEQKEQSAAYFQSEAQKVKEELKALRTSQASAPEAPVVPQVPATQQPQTPQQQVPQTREELNEYLRENPMESFEAFGQTILQGIEGRLDARDRKREMESQGREANRMVKKFCADHKVPAGTQQQAQQWITESGLKGDPVAISSAIVDRIQYIQLVGGNQQVATEAAAKAATAAQTQVLTTQPETVTPANQGPRNLEEQIAQKFGPSKADDFASQFK